VPPTFAWLWENWRELKGGENIFSATIVLGAANEWRAQIHVRMLVILAPARSVADGP
jgi:putative SOS response-associated peptidase YedK